MDKTVKLLILSDIFLITGFGLIDPFLAVFIKDRLINGTLVAAGFATTLFLITKSLVQLPFSKYVDNHKEKIRYLIIGTLIISIVPFIFVLANRIEHIYLAQIIRGIGAGLAVPTWLSLFTTHIDRGKESYEWSIYITLVGLGIALSGLIGAAIASFFGFRTAFVIVGILTLIAAFILFNLEMKDHKEKIKIHHFIRKHKI